MGVKNNNDTLHPSPITKLGSKISCYRTVNSTTRGVGYCPVYTVQDVLLDRVSVSTGIILFPGLLRLETSSRVACQPTLPIDQFNRS